jgi:murein DD-endopeptidase MepM/ murein hydrolase activator NlpD
MAYPRHEAPHPDPRERPSGGRRTGAALVAVLALITLGLATLFWLPGSTAQVVPTPDASRAPRTPSAAGSPQVAGGSSATARAGATASPRARATISPEPARQTAPMRTATPQPTRHPNAAPASAEDFDAEAQVIRMGFPLKERDKYRYRDNFGAAREGRAEGYNHARVRRDGDLLRAHDGIDIYAAAGTPVVAPFDGVVIDPSRRWDPWVKERYGKTAAIRSSEPLSEGYTALLTHLQALYVEPGQRVHRGEVVGTVGDSGNAEGGRPHLHFELRAPFPLQWQQAGEDRLVDAFNPYPSLRAADPKRSD